LIVAVNRDPQAAIFNVSDYIIIEDLNRFLPVLLEQHQAMFPRG
jgi:electron transfer flavoprotein alpha subunit